MSIERSIKSHIGSKVQFPDENDRTLTGTLKGFSEHNTAMVKVETPTGTYLVNNCLVSLTSSRRWIGAS